LQRQKIWAGGAALATIGALILIYFSYFRPPEVITTMPYRGKAIEAVYATGTVEPVRYARVGTKIAGSITEVLKHEGDSVEQGDILAVIEASEDITRVQELAARLKLAEVEFDRTARLRRTGNASQAALDQAESAQSAARAAYRGAKARLDDHFITAPVSGELLRSENQVKVGDMVQPGQIIFMVGDPSALQIDGEVDEEDIVKVEPGQDALIRADAFPGQALKARVARITPYGDPVARTYRVYLTLPEDTPLISGMTTEINIIVRREDNALLVPVSALSGSSIWVVEDGKALLVNAELGSIGEENVEILSGLPENASVIVSPPAGLNAGDKVRPRSMPRKAELQD
jgi:RND family efflux transporter MFP subunit|tara:strand:+ start:15684 stop:16721 length:1038 start_codon:yes stop_codon:yes gene_type:complete